MADPVNAPNPMSDYDRRIALYQEHRRIEAATADALARMAVDLGMAAVKGATLINGGAAVALLTFLGTRPAGANVPWAADALSTFGWGTLIAVLAGAFSYLSQFCYAQALTGTVKLQLSLFPGDKNAPLLEGLVKKGHRTLRAATAFNVLAVLTFMVSIAFFAWGVHQAKQGFIVDDKSNSVVAEQPSALTASAPKAERSASPPSPASGASR
jgi:hypothetical protein